MRLDKGDYVVGIHYRALNDETWYPTGCKHPRLVEKVSEIKLHFNGAPGAPFYSNEYKQVLVPVEREAEYYYSMSVKAVVCSKKQ